MKENLQTGVPAVVQRCRKNRQQCNVCKCWVFIGAMLFFAVVGLLVPFRPTESEVEKRTLAKFPSFHWQTFVDGTYFSEIETWYADTYPMREALIAGNARMREWYGSKEQEFVVARKDDRVSAQNTAESLEQDNDKDKEAAVGEKAETLNQGAGDGSVDRQVAETAGDVYIADGRGFELFYFSEAHSKRYAAMVNQLQQAVGNEVRVYCLLAPVNAGIILSEKMQARLGSSNQQEAISYIGKQLDDAVTLVDCYDMLRAHNQEDIYFRTDHHWTQRGAYYGYCAFAKAAGFTAHDLNEYETKTAEGFLGTFYADSRSESLKKHADQVETFLPMQVNEYTGVDKEGASFQKPLVADPSEYSAGAKYMCFLGGDQPMGHIQNPKQAEGTSILVIKESYANCFLPFLADHYQDVYLIDYRYYQGSVAAFVKEHKIREVLFLNNVSAINERLRLNEMEMILK